MISETSFISCLVLNVQTAVELNILTTNQPFAVAQTIHIKLNGLAFAARSVRPIF